MHAVVVDSLEEYLAGLLEPAALRDIEAHLKTCQACREEVAGMQQVSLWMARAQSRNSRPNLPRASMPG